MQSLGVLDLTYASAGDLSAKRYHFVHFSAARTVDGAGADAEDICGVLQNEPSAAGYPADVRHSGTTEIKASAAFAAGARLTSDADGKAVTAGANKAFFAIAIDAALAEDDIVEVLLVSGRTAA